MAAKKREAVKPMKPQVGWMVVRNNGTPMFSTHWTDRGTAVAWSGYTDCRVARVEIREVEPKRRRK